MSKVLKILASLLLLGTVACQTLDNKYYTINHNHQAAEKLAKAAKVRLGTSKPLIVASFVNINNLDESSSLGRSISQQFATTFTNSGYRIIELLLRKDIYIKQDGGEFLLSRELANLSHTHQAQAVVVGTYAVGETRVYVTAKVINADSNVVLAAQDYSLPIDKDTRALLMR